MKERLITASYTVKTNGRAQFRAAVVSDTHEADPAPIIEAVRLIAPDIIFLPGDIVEAKTPLSAALHDGAKSRAAYELLRGLCHISPVYYGLGNHETCLTERQRKEIAKTDVHLLEDSYARVKLHGRELIIGAVLCPEHDGGEGMIRRMLDNFRRQDCYRVLMCHRPERYIHEFYDERDDIVLAGHAHGGQWRAFGRGVYAPGQGLFPKYTRGFYGNLLVSAGAHNSEVIPRINDPCEILDVRFVL